MHIHHTKHLIIYLLALLSIFFTDPIYAGKPKHRDLVETILGVDIKIIPHRSQTPANGSSARPCNSVYIVFFTRDRSGRIVNLGRTYITNLDRYLIVPFGFGAAIFYDDNTVIRYRPIDIRDFLVEGIADSHYPRPGSDLVPAQITGTDLDLAQRSRDYGYVRMIMTDPNNINREDPEINELPDPETQDFFHSERIRLYKQLIRDLQRLRLAPRIYAPNTSNPPEAISCTPHGKSVAPLLANEPEISVNASRISSITGTETRAGSQWLQLSGDDSYIIPLASAPTDDSLTTIPPLALIAVRLIVPDTVRCHLPSSHNKTDESAPKHDNPDDPNSHTIYVYTLSPGETVRLAPGLVENIYTMHYPPGRLTLGRIDTVVPRTRTIPHIDFEVGLTQIGRLAETEGRPERELCRLLRQMIHATNPTLYQTFESHLGPRRSTEPGSVETPDIVGPSAASPTENTTAVRASFIRRILEFIQAHQIEVVIVNPFARNTESSSPDETEPKTE